MNRKEFLETLWIKVIKPIFLIALIVFCIRFFFYALKENGSERFIILLILGLVILATLAYLIGFLFKSFITRIYSRLPDSVKLWLKITGKIFDYVMPLILGICMYYFWQTEQITAIIMLGIYLVHRIVEIIKEEKKSK